MMITKNKEIVIHVTPKLNRKNTREKHSNKIQNETSNKLGSKRKIVLNEVDSMLPTPKNGK